MILILSSFAQNIPYVKNGRIFCDLFQIQRKIMYMSNRFYAARIINIPVFLDYEIINVKIFAYYTLYIF